MNINAKEKEAIEKKKKYKTELCSKWLEKGFCQYGEKCRFAHGEKELIHKKKGRNYKKTPCKTFQEKGYCNYGSRCNFIHFDKKISLELFYELYCKLFGEVYHGSKRLRAFEEITNDKIEKNDHNENIKIDLLSFLVIL